MLDRKLEVALLLWCLAIAAGCGETVESDEMVEPDTTGYASTASYPRTYSGQTSIEERIIDADVVARVRMVSVEAGAVDSELPPVFGDRKRAAMKFRFRVLEYLNGSGGSEIVGFVSDAPYEFITAADAMPRARELLDGRDTRWDDREAIVFLAGEAGEYRLGYATLEGTSGEDGFTVASRWDRRWLPEATATFSQGASRSSGDKRFLLDDPASSGASRTQRASGASATAPTITLSALKAKVAEVQSEIAAGDGSDEYRECVARRYALDRRWRWEIAQGGAQRKWYEGHIDSGLPAGSIVHSAPYGAPAASGYWMGGRDQDLFAVVTTTPEGFPNQVLHHVVTARPVPAGEYRMNTHVLRPDELICGGWSEFVKNSGGTYLTVTAPAGTLHEAFFDPVDIGTAVGADSSDGVLKPAAFTVGGANTTISSLKWEAGTATMTLSPSTSLAGHAVDFIALDGSVSLALSFDDATRSGGTLTWSVASQPWQAGDLLMLRIRSTNVIITPPTATPTPTPTAAPTATPTATPTPAATPTPTPTPMATPTPTPTPTPTSTPTPTTTEPVTVTLIPRVDGLTFFDIDIQWSHSGSCENYFVAITTDADYQIQSLGFHPPETSSHYVEGGWLYNNVPDFWVVVECRTSGQTQEVGRASLRAAHPDNN